MNKRSKKWYLKWAHAAHQAIEVTLPGKDIAMVIEAPFEDVTPAIDQCIKELGVSARGEWEQPSPGVMQVKLGKGVFKLIQQASLFGDSQ